jgi:hypothetical protein
MARSPQISLSLEQLTRAMAEMASQGRAQFSTTGPVSSGPDADNVRRHQLALGAIDPLVAAGRIDPGEGHQMKRRSRAVVGAAGQVAKASFRPSARTPRFGSLAEDGGTTLVPHAAPALVRDPNPLKGVIR